MGKGEGEGRRHGTARHGRRGFGLRMKWECFPDASLFSPPPSSLSRIVALCPGQVNVARRAVNLKLIEQNFGERKRKRKAKSAAAAAAADADASGS